VCIIHVWHPDIEMTIVNIGKRIRYAIKRTKRDKLNVFVDDEKREKGPLTTQEYSQARTRVPGVHYSPHLVLKC